MREQLLGKPRGEILPVHVPVIIPCPFRGLTDQLGPWDPSCDRHGMDNNQTWPLARGFVDPRPSSSRYHVNCPEWFLFTKVSSRYTSGRCRLPSGLRFALF